MKKVIAVFALAAFMGAATAQTKEQKPAAKKEACCKKEGEAKAGCDKDSKKACCQKKAAEAKKPAAKKAA